MDLTSEAWDYSQDFYYLNTSQNHDTFFFTLQPSNGFTSANASTDQGSGEPPALYEASPAIIAVLAVFYGAISLLALVGNSLVVLCIASSKQMQSVTNFLLANLASADILIAVAAVPFQFQAALLQRWVLPEFLCILAPFVQVLSVNVSVFTLTVISIERYRALLYPFKSRITKSATSYAIAIIWIVAVVCAAPMAASLRVVVMEDDLSGPRLFCFPSGLSTPVNDSTRAKEEAIEESTRIFRYYVVFLVAIQFAIPLLIISFAYITIALHLWGTKGPGEGQQDMSLVRIQQRQKVIKMLILVVVLFALSWMPLQTYNFLTAIIPQINMYSYINIIWFCCNFLAMSNSCQNPFILGFCNEKFRRQLRRKCRWCLGLRRNNSMAGGGSPNINHHIIRGGASGVLEVGNSPTPLPNGNGVYTDTLYVTMALNKGRQFRTASQRSDIRPARAANSLCPSAMNSNEGTSVDDRDYECSVRPMLHRNHSARSHTKYSIAAEYYD
ncbi:hypothetical protein RvY_08620 [Ramazzottius varieornatus]|uniref:G-protein coupled receptors family 1 profile domain-containing protein n=1 Tax=Ramazzottius varieornatus TaxID=947166 RepID=A0A1D1V6H4_RAMVA|nr:hypothetical protein RvY_08620 [Ramazzottius varieornatus]